MKRERIAYLSVASSRANHCPYKNIRVSNVSKMSVERPTVAPRGCGIGRERERERERKKEREIDSERLLASERERARECMRACHTRVSQNLIGVSKLLHHESHTHLR